MQSRALTIRLELDLAPDCLTGRAFPDRGSSRQFSGWLGMVGAIDALLAESDTGAEMTDVLTAHQLVLVTPDDAAYDDVRQSWNLATDQRPAAVALPTTVAEVVTAVDYAIDNGLRIAVQSTGHNPVHGSLADVVLLKTERMAGVTVDPVARRARVEAGAQWQHVTDAAAEHGLIGLAGSAPDVGVAGYALGGGLSWLARDKGLAANHVHAIEAVLADGRHVRADRDNDPELFWALRGGGGNYAVATAFEIELFPFQEIYAGMMLFPWERSGEVLQAWREWTRTAPEAITTSARIIQFPPLPELPDIIRGRNLLVIDGAHTGSEQEAIEALRPLRELGPEFDGFGMMPAAALSAIHMDPPDPMPVVSDTLLLNELPAEAVDALVVAAGPDSGSALMLVEVRHLGGALAREPEGAGVRSKLDGEYLFFAGGVPMDPDVVAALQVDLPRMKAALEPYASGRDYLNFVEHEIDPARLFSEDAYRRLQAVKAQYDPQDLFQANNHRISQSP